MKVVLLSIVLVFAGFCLGSYTALLFIESRYGVEQTCD